MDQNGPISVGISKSRLVIGGILHQHTSDNYYHKQPVNSARPTSLDVTASYLPVVGTIGHRKKQSMAERISGL
jgi:hypothetical protein